MNHKYRCPKRRRAGCLMCKPQKAKLINPDRKLGHTGFGKLRTLAAARDDEKAELGKSHRRDE